MIRRIGWVTALAAGTALLAGCPPTWPKCEKDEHCNTDGHTGVCVNGTCQECGKDADCKSGFVCKDYQCKPKPECTKDADCAANKKCENEHCVDCRADGDCPTGQRCEAYRCAPKAECNVNSDCPGGKECQAGTCVEAVAGKCSLEKVYFGFNEWLLTPEARRILDANADCMKKNKATVTIAGHCDERGTEEYNLHLGEKRAAAVKKYLSDLGVDGGKLKTISYGEERPASNGHDEAAWSQNRRAEFSE